MGYGVEFRHVILTDSLSKSLVQSGTAENGMMAIGRGVTRRKLVQSSVIQIARDDWAWAEHFRSSQIIM
ncbi:hypothetical protein C9427_07985 [Mesorhizobium helmanticense]|uniref:Uncharacterized protein n=1 Tax=Mesorhizobium helmanticense TaxID=1776423 RepID=A0A2T4IYZ2_9HYPH|nr:hypothetical protein C9427_07985 [Mesorhizobium helmanticense]